MRCDSCGGAIVLLSGKGTGYYGCYNSRRKTCQNMLLVPRKRIEQTIIAELTEKIMTAENVEYVYKRVEKVAAEGLNTLPDLMKTKKLQYEKLQQSLAVWEEAAKEYQKMLHARSVEFKKLAFKKLKEAQFQFHEVHCRWSFVVKNASNMEKLIAVNFSF